MIVSTIALRLSEGDRRKVISSLLPVVRSTRAQAGCRGCAVLTDVEDPRTLLLREEWDSQEQLDRHLRSEDYRLVLAAIELSQAAPQIRFDTVTTRAGIEMIEAARLPRTS
jgi:quinol monooxygenase YgiN